MTFKHSLVFSVAAALFAFAGSASALTASCTGVPASASITWTGASADGVAPVALLWGTGATTSPLTVAAVAGTHTMALQVTDASSSVATTTCNATVAAAPTSTATTTPSTLTQIQALFAQIEQLRKQIALLLSNRIGDGSGTSATSTPMGCFGFWRDLKRGDEGEDVRELQKELAKSDPTLFPPGLVNGIFGPKTEAALKMFQRRFGIDVSGTGFFGPKSRGHFIAACSRGDSDDDGLRNFEDPDDDNDGVDDASDWNPFNPNATSSPQKGKQGPDDGNRGGKGKGKGPDGDDD